MVSVIITSKPVIYSQKHMLENLRLLYYTFFSYFSFDQNQLKEMFAFSSWSILKLIDQKFLFNGNVKYFISIWQIRPFK